MSPLRLDPAELASQLAALLPDGGRTLVQGASGESRLLAEAVMTAGDALAAVTFTGIFLPGVNTCSYLANRTCRNETFFMTPQLQHARDQVQFLPLSYTGIRDRLLSVPIDAALFMVAPPDANGLCSFGPCVDFLAEVWPRIPVRIAHINPLLPATGGWPGIPFDALTACIEAEQANDAKADRSDDPTATAIAAHIAPLVPDGATLQTGIGKIPGAVLRALTGRRNLKMHSGLIGDGVVDLLEAGALAPGAAITAGVAIGSQRLYDVLGRDCFSFQPVAVTHDARRIAAIPDFLAINSAIEADLFGQAYAELTPKGLMSGPGGATDYARGARIGHGLRLLAFPASAANGSISRIVAPGAASGPVSLSRWDTDIIVTEHGAADLRGRDYDARAEALIAIAAPDHRPGLASAWAAWRTRM